MKEPLISTPMKRTSRPGLAVGLLEAAATGSPAVRRAGARSAATRTARERIRMSGRLPDARAVQLRDNLARVLQVLHGPEGQFEQVPVRYQERDEVERRRDNLHRRHEEGLQQSLALGADPLKLCPELAGEGLREESEPRPGLDRGVPVSDALTLDDRHHRGSPGGGEQEPGQTAYAEPRDSRDPQSAGDAEVEVPGCVLGEPRDQGVDELPVQEDDLDEHRHQLHDADLENRGPVTAFQRGRPRGEDRVASEHDEQHEEKERNPHSGLRHLGSREVRERIDYEEVITYVKMVASNTHQKKVM